MVLPKRFSNMNTNQLRDLAVELGADKTKLYGTSKQALIITINRLERLGGKKFVQLQESIRRSLTKHQQSGDSNDMLGFRLSGMIEGLQLANELNDQQALEIIIAMKNHFNF